MAPVRKHAKSRGKRARNVVSSSPEQSEIEDTNVAESANESDQETEVQLPSKSRKISTSAAKPRSRKAAPVRSHAEAPTINSSPDATPQPEQNSKRKGGNKRKWAHEYCLTCTRYGRACSGKRDIEEGCATCRDPDRTKGEKLRECLWADAEAGIFDYQTARAIFKKAQAEARALRKKPSTARRETQDEFLSTAVHADPSYDVDAAVVANHVPATEHWHEISRPLDLKPPALSRPSFHAQMARSMGAVEDDGVDFDHSYPEVDSPLPGVLQTHIPGVHDPRMTIITVNSDNEEQVTEIPGHLRAVVISSAHSMSRPQGDFQSKSPAPYFNADLNAWKQPNQRSRVSHRNTRPSMYVHRSAYDPYPASISTKSRLDQAKHTHENLAVQIAGDSGPVQPLDVRPSSTRKWSSGGRRIQSVSGVEWETKKWKERDQSTNQATIQASTSDSSSLSSFVSMEDVVLKDDLRGRAGDANTSTTYTDPPATSLAISYGLDPQGTTAFDNSAPRVRLDGPKAGGLNQTPVHMIDNIIHTSNKCSKSFTIPGEITIQEDEEGNDTSDGDSELTDDEGKLKSIPSKLRKVLSRSRVTKVIIGDDVFEIRPKTQISSAKIRKAHAKNGKTRHTSLRSSSKSKGKQVLPIQENEAEDEDLTSDELYVDDPSREPVTNQVTGKPVPLKIRLVFKRNAIADSAPQAETETNPLAVSQVDFENNLRTTVAAPDNAYNNINITEDSNAGIPADVTMLNE